MIELSKTYHFQFSTVKAGVGFTAAVSCTLYRNGAAEATSVSVNTTAITGQYRASFTTDANWSTSDQIQIVAVATIDSVANYIGTVWDSQCIPEPGVENIRTRIPDQLVGGRLKAVSTLETDQAVNVTKVGGTTVTGPNDLKANVSGLAQESTVNAVGVALVDVSTRIPDALEGGRIKAVATVSTAGLATEATQLAILAQTSLIGTGAVSVTSPVRQDGTLNDLVVGDAYQQATGRAIQITITGVSAGLQTALATATVHLGFRAFGKSRQSPEFRRYEFAGTIVSVGASTVVRFELTTAQTKGILPGRYDYDIEFRTGGNYLTEVASVEDAPMSWLESSTTLPT
jgi:hypothetical protein